jgi:hypothetical protein
MRQPRYICLHNAAFAGRCEGQNFAARIVDELVSRQLLLAVSAAAIELNV